MSNKKLDKKIVGIVGLSISSSPFLYFYEESLAQVIRLALESKLLHLLIWVLIFTTYAIHYLKIRRNDDHNNIVLSSTLPPFMDSFFGAATYGAIITSTLTLIKGLYIQLTFEEEHFKNFSDFDISSLAIALFFLLWYAYAKISEDIRDIFWVDNVGKVEVINKNVNSPPSESVS